MSFPFPLRLQRGPRRKLFPLSLATGGSVRGLPTAGLAVCQINAAVRKKRDAFLHQKETLPILSAHAEGRGGTAVRMDHTMARQPLRSAAQGIADHTRPVRIPGETGHLPVGHRTAAGNLLHHTVNSLKGVHVRSLRFRWAAQRGSSSSWSNPRGPAQARSPDTAAAEAQARRHDPFRRKARPPCARRQP